MATSHDRGLKRIRDSSEAPQVQLPSTAALRAGLADRLVVDSLPPSWRAAASAAGVYDSDSFLCHLGRSIVASLQSVPVASETARVQLASVRATLHSAIDSRCDELEGRVNSAESSKIAAFERELCAVDAALERWRAERSAAAEAAASLDDAEFLARYAELVARLDGAQAQLLALPTTAIELPHVGLVVDTQSVMASIEDFGRLDAPRAIVPVDLALLHAPLHARSGDVIQMSVLLRSALHDSQSAAELGVSLGVVAAAMRVDAYLWTPDAEPLVPLQVSIAASVPLRCVHISVLTPLDAPDGSTVELSAPLLYGHPVASSAWFIQLLVQHGMQAPLVLKSYGMPLCVYPERGICLHSRVGAPACPCLTRMGLSGRVFS